MRNLLRLWTALVVVAATGCNVSSPVSRRIGAQCTAHDECDEICLAPPDYPDGFCSVVCDDNGDCPADSACVDSGQGICLFTCQEPADCAFLGAAWTCAPRMYRTGGGVNVCVGQ